MKKSEIEKIAWKRTRELDQKLKTKEINQETYDLEIRLLDQWAQQCHNGRWC